MLGDVAIQGQLQAVAGSNLTVQGNLVCNNSGSLVFYAPSSIAVMGSATMIGNPALQLIVTQAPDLTQLTATTYSLVVQVATYASTSGSFGGCSRKFGFF